MNLSFLDEAEAEVESARTFLNERSHRLGRRFLDELGSTLDAIAARPESFPRLETLPDDSVYRRALLSTFRYAVFFEILPDEIVVIAVAHTSREPNYWIDRHV